MSYSDITGHASMAFDATRNAVYAQAISKFVTPDSVVLDLGAGLGTLGMLAARAGARRVFMVEPEAVVLAAEEVARRNGLADRVQVFRGRIEDIELPEAVDVIISVFTGNLLFSEDLLPSLYYARDRWLKPGGVLIPDAAQLMLAPVSAPRTHAELIGQWSQPHMGIDFSSLRRFAPNNMPHFRSKDFNAQLLAAPKAVVDLDLRTSMTADLDVSTETVASMAADCSGLLAWIRIRLGDAWLGTGPLDPEVHWTPGFMPLDPELPLAADDRVAVSLRRPAHGEYTWQVSAPAGRRRHSTFLGQPHSLPELRRMAEDATPDLSQRGLAALAALNALHNGQTNLQVATQLHQDFVGQYASVAQALEFVRDLIRRFAR